MTLSFVSNSLCDKPTPCSKDTCDGEHISVELKRVARLCFGNQYHGKNLVIYLPSFFSCTIFMSMFAKDMFSLMALIKDSNLV